MKYSSNERKGSEPTNDIIGVVDRRPGAVNARPQRAEAFLVRRGYMNQGYIQVDHVSLEEKRNLRQKHRIEVGRS